MEKTFEEQFNTLFRDEAFSLPIRWDGKDYYESLMMLFDQYKIFFKWNENETFSDSFHTIERTCKTILEATEKYLDGHPEESYKRIDELLKELLEEYPLWIYQKNYYDPAIISRETRSNKPKLFRMARVSENKKWDRKRMFHTPYDMRSKMATTRYSIAGFPSLYLSTSIDLCEEELEASIHASRYIASRFEIAEYSGISIKVIEMGIKPSDFFISETEKDNGKRSALLAKADLKSFEIKRNYCIWYPLIAACSFIRINKEDPFAVEYIIPQLVTQAVRKSTKDEVWGIRYFSCSSKYASELGFNYVFPTSGIKSESDNRYCKNLVKTFLLTMPLFNTEYKTNANWEMALRNMKADYLISQE